MFDKTKVRGFKRAISLLAILSLVAPVQLSSHAAGLPTVRVISPEFNAKNDTFAGDQLGQWYAVGGRSFYKYVGAGSTITLTYQVTTDGTTPAADKSIKFMVNAPYSDSKASWEVDGKAVGASKNSDNGYGLLLTGKTNSEGKISFTIKNADSAALAEAIPTSETQPRPAANARLYGVIKTVIDGLSDMQQAIDLVTFDITKEQTSVLPAPSPSPSAEPSPSATPEPTASPSPSASPSESPSPTPTPDVKKDVPTVRLISPTYTDANSVDTSKAIAQWYSANTKAWYTYAQSGSTITLKYKVTKDGVTPWANFELTLQVNAPYSGSKAKWSSGSVNIQAPAADGAPGGELKAKTNAQGEVTFILKNSDTTGLEPAPKSANAPLPATRLYGTLKPVVSGFQDKEVDIDIVTFDIYEAPKPIVKKTTITCVKGKVIKKVTAISPKCPSGYKKK